MSARKYPPQDSAWFGYDTTGTAKVGGIAFDEDYTTAGNRDPKAIPPRGIFAEVPASTPKYARHQGEETFDFRESMARLYLQVPDYKAFLAEFAETNPESQKIAQVLGGTVKDGNTSTGEGNGYVDFLLQNVQHSFQEKSQVVETLADEHVAYFFGQAAPVFSYSGTLINTKQDDQAINMLRLYRDMGRGTMLAQRTTLISIRYDGMIVSGAMLSFNMGLNADMEMAVSFNFNLLVKQQILLPNPYSGLVQLSDPFAVTRGRKNDQYQPFSQGLSTLPTTSVKVVAAPAANLAPPASQSVDPKKEEAEVTDKRIEAAQKLMQWSQSKKNPDPGDQQAQKLADAARAAKSR